MLRKDLYLALAAALILVPAAAQASDNFLSRAVSERRDEGRWLNRRCTIRHEAPKSVRREDNFASRMVSEPGDKGRWLNRRFTFRHEGQA